MYYTASKSILLISSFVYLQAVSSVVAAPEYHIKTFEKVLDGPEVATSVTVDIRRDVQAAVKDDAVPAIPEARCGSFVYNSDYIQKTLDTITDLESRGASAGDSGFPKPLADQGRVMIFPLLRNTQIFDGITNNQPGPDRIAVGMEGKRYTIFTAEGQPNPETSTDFQTCEYLMPENAQLVPNPVST